jgi:hypothetical protein
MWTPVLNRHLAYNNEIISLLKTTPESLLDSIKPSTAQHNIIRKSASTCRSPRERATPLINKRERIIFSSTRNTKISTKTSAHEEKDGMDTNRMSLVISNFKKREATGVSSNLVSKFREYMHSHQIAGPSVESPIKCYRSNEEPSPISKLILKSTIETAKMCYQELYKKNEIEACNKFYESLLSQYPGNCQINKDYWIQELQEIKYGSPSNINLKIYLNTQEKPTNKQSRKRMYPEDKSNRMKLYGKWYLRPQYFSRKLPQNALY